MARKDRMRIIHRKKKTKLFSNFNIVLFDWVIVQGE